jgi:hypothetical protein
MDKFTRHDEKIKEAKKEGTFEGKPGQTGSGKTPQLDDQDAPTHQAKVVPTEKKR